MTEIDLNNGMFREVDLNKPCFCSRCNKEIVRNEKSVNLTVNVHACGYVFCNECKKKLNDYVGKKVAEYEKKLVERFVNGEKIYERIESWINDMGGESCSVYQYVPDEEIAEIFLKAIKYA